MNDEATRAGARRPSGATGAAARQTGTAARPETPANGNGELDGKVALITGAGGAIGSAIARALAADGASAVIADLDLSAAERIAESISGARAVQIDVANRESCRRVVAEIAGGEGRLDILVNNAGLQFVAPIDEYPDDRFDLLMKVMVYGTFYLTKDVLPLMRQGGWGRILNMGSIHSLIASPNKSAYTAAKHAILGFTRATALEAAADGITANCICPTYVRTPLVMNQIEPQARTLGITEGQVVSDVMLGPAAVKRFLEADEVAALARFLCSNAAGGITGSAQMIDGGWTAR
jgi:3-hydroxybutyrate dehydrogenase